jgi:enoyl-CoA hydratase/carnithine racemase
MQNRNTLAHFLHDAGLAAWFGGSLMGAIGVNGAAADVDDPRQRARVANAGWGRWTPFNLVAIGAHLVGGAQLLKANKGRVATQKGVLANTNVKLALTAGALGATAYSRLLGQKVMNAGDTEPLPSTPPEVAKAQKQLKALQWAIPGLTGAVLASSSLHEEQQRPSEVLKGTLKAVPGRAAALGATAAATAATAATGAYDKVSDKVREAV